MSDKRDRAPFMSRVFPDVTPLQQNKRDEPGDGKNKPLPVRRKSEETFAPPPLRTAGKSEISANDELSYQGNGIQNRVMKDLRRGKIPVEDVLDLHGKTVEQAHEVCMNFLHQSQQSAFYCVLIIHGRGYRSEGGIPILKQQVDYWLQQHDAVLAYCSAIPRDGGTGAVYALLRRN